MIVIVIMMFLQWRCLRTPRKAIILSPGVTKPSADTFQIAAGFLEPPLNINDETHPPVGGVSNKTDKQKASLQLQDTWIARCRTCDTGNECVTDECLAH